MTSLAVITPGPVANISPLLPGKTAGRATDWEWYHRCLSDVGEVRYLAPREWESATGFDAVLVHEGLALSTGAFTIGALERLRSRNGKVVWVEPHDRTTFSAPVFERGFFDVVDLVAKYQLMDWPTLQRELETSDNSLAPWAFYGHASLAGFYSDPRLFGLPTSRETFERHLGSDLAPRYGTQIVPMMRLFTFPRPTSWYAGTPSRQPDVLKESQIGIALGDGASACLRGVLAGVLAQGGLTVKFHRSIQRAAATSEAFLALGPVHLDGSAADVLRFDTLAVLPHDERYVVWDDVYIPGETYLPLRGIGELLRAGGRMVNGEAAARLTAHLHEALADEPLRERVLEGQRRAHAKLLDPAFVAGKLGIEGAPSPPATAFRAPAIASRAPATAPRRIGAIATDEISVVIQGALGGELTEQVIESARAVLPGAEIVVSTWEGQRELAVEVDRRVESADPGAPWQVAEDWPSNTNRLLVSTRAGLQAATRPYALKLRTDTPLTGTGFLDIFQSYPERGTGLRLLRDRMVVINYYCWNPEKRPFGLFCIADTVNFGWTADLLDVWDRPLDPEPEIATWFETHARPDPDPAPWTVFRYTPEQLMWLGFLRKHVRVPFDHFCDERVAARVLSELSKANNTIIVEPDPFGVALPKFADREELEPEAIITHGIWQDLYERYCVNSPNPALDALLAQLRPDAPGPGPEREDRAQWFGRLDELAAHALTRTWHPLRGARDFVVLADAEELIAGADLLREYARAMGGCQRATLAIDASRLPLPAAEQQVVELVRRAGVSEREDIDLLAVVGAQDELQRRRMLGRTAALYRRHGEPDGPVAVFTPESLAELRRLADGAGAVAAPQSDPARASSE